MGKKDKNKASDIPEFLEKSLYREHGLSRIEYQQCINNKVKVEQKRAMSHEKNKRIQAKVASQVIR